MSRILVTYATNSGSTAEVANAVAFILQSAGHSTRVLPLHQVEGLEDCDSLVLGAPMILGWHADARRFLRRNQKALGGRKIALFACAMRLTVAPDQPVLDIDLAIDPGLAAAPLNPAAFTIKERFTSLGRYLHAMLASTPQKKPVSVAFFHGRLDLYRLKWWQAAFLMAFVQASPGDYRDWDFIHAWARRLASLL